MTDVYSFFSNAAYRLKDRLRRALCYSHWAVGVVDVPIEQLLTAEALPPVRWLTSAKDKERYLADPFPWPGSRDTFLAESYDLVARIGHLVAVKYGPQGIIDEIPLSVPLTGHLSFPFLFEHAGEIFIMPESSAAKRLDILHWRPQDGAWIPFSTVFDKRAVADATLFEHDGLFWISFTDTDRNPHDNLNLVFAEDLRGPWVEHPGNPVRGGLKSSRNGGAVFSVEGKLFRPAQDCSKHYGCSLRIMEMVTCSPTHYEEIEVKHFLPAEGEISDGFHTLMSAQNVCLIDGMSWRFDMRFFLRKTAHRLRHAIKRIKPARF